MPVQCAKFSDGIRGVSYLLKNAPLQTPTDWFSVLDRCPTFTLAPSSRVACGTLDWCARFAGTYTCPLDFAKGKPDLTDQNSTTGTVRPTEETLVVVSRQKAFSLVIGGTVSYNALLSLTSLVLSCLRCVTQGLMLAVSPVVIVVLVLAPVPPG